MKDLPISKESLDNILKIEQEREEERAIKQATYEISTRETQAKTLKKDGSSQNKDISQERRIEGVK